LDPERISIHTSHSFERHSSESDEKRSLYQNSIRNLPTVSTEQDDTEATAPAEPSDPPSFSSHNFSSSYFPSVLDRPESYKVLVTTPTPDSPGTSAPAPPFDAPSSSSYPAVVAETKAALPRDSKDREGPGKDLDDGEPPPPYTEGSSPLNGLTYVMSAAGGAASIITQVQQSGPAPISTLHGRSL